MFRTSHQTLSESDHLFKRYQEKASREWETSPIPYQSTKLKERMENEKVLYKCYKKELA